MSGRSDVHHPVPAPIDIIAFAQNAEDVVLCRAFDGIRDGVYVDLGAGDPVEGSVTKNLIDRLGWTGLDIEPQMALSVLLEAAHPKSTVLRIAIGLAAESRTFYRLTDNWGMSTLDPEVARRHSDNGWNVVTEEISVLPLNDVLSSAKLSRFDLLKVDVEGLEDEVFGSIDVGKWQPNVIVAEATAPALTVQTHSAWEDAIIDSGYELCLFDGLNRFYVRSELAELKGKLSIPANVFDRYIHLRWWRGLTSEARHLADPDGKFANVQ